MKKIFSLLVILLLLSFSVKIYAQILTPNIQANEISEYHISSSTNFIQDHSDKIVRWNDDFSVVLNTLTTNNQATFGLLEKGNINTSKTVYIPIGYNISDFTILRDTLYFVGHKFDAIDTTKGIIGYVNVGDLFSNNNQAITYAEIKTTKKLFRVEAYNKENGETVVAAVGRQLYGSPYFVEGPDSEFEDDFPSGPDLPLPPNTNVITPQITGENQPSNTTVNEIGPMWYLDTLEFRYCLATLNIKRTTNGVNHQYDLWNLPTMDTVEVIIDFSLTSDYIYIVSILLESGANSEFKTLTLHWFDKNNLNIRKAKRIYGSKYMFDYSNNRGNLETTSVGGNDIAVCFIADVGVYCNVLYKLRLDSTTVTPIFAHYFGNAGQNIKHPIWDLEYIKKFNMLAVLKRSSKYEYVDEVWHLSMNDNTMMPYESYVHTKYYDNLSSLELYNEIYLGVYGNIVSKKILLEKQCNEFNSFGDCYDMRKDRVYSELLPDIYDHQLTNHCIFTDLLSLITLPATQSVNEFNVSQINQHNIVKSCENIKTDVIYVQPSVIR